jgi:hypothetical protein
MHIKCKQNLLLFNAGNISHRGRSSPSMAEGAAAPAAAEVGELPRHEAAAARRAEAESPADIWERPPTPLDDSRASTAREREYGSLDSTSPTLMVSDTAIAGALAMDLASIDSVDDSRSLDSGNQSFLVGEAPAAAAAGYREAEKAEEEEEAAEIHVPVSPLMPTSVFASDLPDYGVDVMSFAESSIATAEVTIATADLSSTYTAAEDGSVGTAGSKSSFQRFKSQLGAGPLRKGPGGFSMRGGGVFFSFLPRSFRRRSG